MKKLLTLALTGLLLGLCSCTGSSDSARDGGEYRVYYSALGDQFASMAVGYETRELSKDVHPVPGLLRELFQDPDTQDLESPFPDGVRLLSWGVEDGCLHLDLSEQYGGLTGIDLTIADACLALTFCQVEGVESVYVTVEGSEIPYRPIQRLTLEDVLLSTGQESPPPQTETPAAGESRVPG